MLVWLSGYIYMINIACQFLIMSSDFIRIIINILFGNEGSDCTFRCFVIILKTNILNYYTIILKTLINRQKDFAWKARHDLVKLLSEKDTVENG